jgi:hypothetical protein
METRMVMANPEESKGTRFPGVPWLSSIEFQIEESTSTAF